MVKRVSDRRKSFNIVRRLMARRCRLGAGQERAGVTRRGLRGKGARERWLLLKGGKLGRSTPLEHAGPRAPMACKIEGMRVAARNFGNGEADGRRELGTVGVGRFLTAFVVIASAGLLAGCSNVVGGSGTSLSGITRTYQRGYVLSEGALDQVPVGSSQEQVLLVLGTPSTVATVNGEVFYYISQTAKKVAFLKPEITDQKVLAIYFGKDRRVTRIAQYGLKDGKVFDFVSQTTPTSGEELSLLRQLFSLVSFDN